MKELPRLITNYKEIEERLNFDPSAEISLENFQKLIHPYKLSNTEICQVKSEKGFCGQAHENGYLGVRKDGKECLIGGHCAKKYFRADETFAKEASRIRREAQITGYIDRISSYLEKKDFYIEKIDHEHNRLKESLSYFNDFKSEIPKSISSKISNMLKTGNNGIFIEVQYVEVNEDGKKVRSWLEQKIASLSGVDAWSTLKKKNIIQEIHEIKDSLNNARTSREISKQKLKEWIDSLDKIEKISKKVGRLKLSIDQFMSQKNLINLIYLIPNQADRSSLALLYLKESKSQYSSKTDAKALIDQSDKEVRESFEKRNFRIPR